MKRSEVHHGEMSEHHGHVLGQNMREAVYINLGLLALKKCIEALNKKVRWVSVCVEGCVPTWPHPTPPHPTRLHTCRTRTQS